MVWRSLRKNRTEQKTKSRPRRGNSFGNGTAFLLNRTEQKSDGGQNRMKKIIVVLALAVCLWMAASAVDVMANNLNSEPIYQSWNLFAMLF